MGDFERKVELDVEGKLGKNKLGQYEGQELTREEKEIQDMISILDGFAKSEDSRLKIKMSDELEIGQTKREYHHGRCDIGSPWACGKAFDAQTEK